MVVGLKGSGGMARDVLVEWGEMVEFEGKGGKTNEVESA